MNDNNQLQSVTNAIKEAKSVIVLLPSEPEEDMVASGLSLHQALKESGKISQIGCSSEIVASSKISGIAEIKETVGSRNLIISFDFKEDDLEKVDYDVRDDGKFYLLIKPKAGAPVPDTSGVKYAYSGAEADLVITLGIVDLEELGKIYASEKDFLDKAEILSLNISPKPASFAKHSIHGNFLSYAELVTSLIEKTDLTLTPAAANNLVSGIYGSTASLSSPKVTADTFSSLAYLMRAGAILPSQHVAVPRFSQPPFFEVPEQADEANASPEPVAVPSDWKKPKIFRAGVSE